MEAVEIRLDAESLAAIAALTKAVERLASELEHTRVVAEFSDDETELEPEPEQKPTEPVRWATQPS